MDPDNRTNDGLTVEVAPWPDMKGKAILLLEARLLKKKVHGFEAIVEIVRVMCGVLKEIKKEGTGQSLANLGRLPDSCS